MKHKLKILNVLRLLIDKFRSGKLNKFFSKKLKLIERNNYKINERKKSTHLMHTVSNKQKMPSIVNKKSKKDENKLH